jgi:CDP-diacylglycerol--glycerol-3-phosphate 3-phosphatidyltransferase
MMKNITNAERRAIFSRLVGNNIARAREVLAAGLVRLHINPNVLTVLGMIVTLAGSVFLALGAGDKIGAGSTAGYSWHGFWAGIFLVFANAFDILDGAVARVGKQATQWGGFLDSCCDRISDGAIFIAICIYYLLHNDQPHWELFTVLSIVALLHAELISYVKARAENIIPACPVGYWQRGERIAAIVIGLFSGHIATVMAMLAVLPAFTVLRRMLFARQQIRRLEKGQPLLDPRAPLKGIMRLALWRYRRGTIQYDLITAANIAIILFVDLQK